MKNDLGNKKLVETYFSCLASGDLKQLGDLFSEDIVWHQPGHGQLSKTYNGKQALFGLFGEFMTISQGSFKIDQVKSILENGDLVAANIHFSAKKSEQSISMDGVDLMKIQDGKIKEVWLFSADQAAEDAFWVK